MQHVKKIKFNSGVDANRALTRKLIGNFVKEGKITTTLQKAKVIKSVIDRLTYKAQTRTESHKNVLLKAFNDRVIVEKMFTDIAPQFKGRSSGFVRIIKAGIRQGDGATIAKVEWVEGVKTQVVKEPDVKPQAKVENENIEAGKMLETGEKMETSKKEVENKKVAVKKKETKKVEK